NGCKDHDSEKEVRDRPSRYDRRALADGFIEKALPALLLAHLRNRVLVRDARGIVVAEEFDVAAQRNCREFPTRVVLVGEAENLRTEADGEHQHAHAAPARDQEVPKLVEKHDDGEDEQERDEPPDGPGSPER